MPGGTALRVLTASILIPLVVAGVWWGPASLVAAVGALASIAATLEFFSMCERLGFQPYRVWTCTAGVLIFVEQWLYSREASINRLGDIIYRARAPQFSLDLVLFIFLLGIAVLILASRRPVSEDLPAVATSVAALFVIAIPFSTIVRLHGVDVIGPRLLLFTLVLVWAGDTAAYFAGRTFGRWKMSPQLSPNKTWEGAAANFLFALLVGALFARWISIPPVHLLAMAGIASVAGQIGDVFESACKRSAGVKDSGTLLPGHGGMFDRIDALIFAAPAVWYYFDWFARRRL